MGVHQGHQRMCDKFQHEHFIFQGHLPAQQHIYLQILTKPVDVGS